MFLASLRYKFAYPAAEAFEADFLVGQWPHRKTARCHALLNAGDEHGVLGIDLPVDAPIQIAGCAHFSTVIGKDITDFTDDAACRAGWQPLHKVDLIGIDIERDRRPEFEIEPVPLVGFGQMRDRRQ